MPGDHGSTARWRSPETGWGGSRRNSETWLEKKVGQRRSELGKFSGFPGKIQPSWKQTKKKKHQCLCGRRRMGPAAAQFHNSRVSKGLHLGTVSTWKNMGTQNFKEARKMDDRVWWTGGGKGSGTAWSNELRSDRMEEGGSG